MTPPSPRPPSPPQGGDGPRALVTALLGLSVLVLLAALVFAGRSTVLFEGEGAFGELQVVERSNGLRVLYFDGGPNRQSALYPGRPMHLELAYSRVAMVGLALVPPDARILFVGLGGGAMPMYVRTVLPGARIDVVEIDPLVVEVAQEYFGFTPDDHLRAHVGDGRAFVEEAPPGSWDLIVLDAFSESGIPRALATRPFLEAVRSRLVPGGVVVSNVPTTNPLSPSMFATWEAVFPEFQRIEVRRHRQQIVVASADGALDRDTLVEAARTFAADRELGFDLPLLIDRGVLPSFPTGGEVLEDEVEVAAASSDST
jgi:spermidine synthase